MLNTGESAQRRRRIFLVADFGGLTAPKILFEQERLLGDLRRAKVRGKELPPQLETALRIQAGVE